MSIHTKSIPQNTSAHVKEKKRAPIKDVIIYLVLLFFLGLIVYSRLHGLTLAEWGGEFTGIVGDFTIYLLGIIGVFEFSYDNGIMFLVPELFINQKEKRQRKQMKEMLMTFFDEESEFLQLHEQSRLAEALSMMGLSSEGYSKIRSKILEALLAPLNNIDTARQKLLDLVFYSGVVIDMHRNAEHISTGALRYYIKFHDLMHNAHQSNAVAKAMATFIVLTCEQQGINLDEVDAIMVPHSSNYLLGLNVSKLLNKHFIKMIHPDKRIGNYSYEGVIPDKSGKKAVDVLIVHDVLLSGRQIYESADSLKATVPNCNILGLFAAIYRNVQNGKETLELSHDIKCYCLAELTEAEIEQEIRSRMDVT